MGKVSLCAGEKKPWLLETVQSHLLSFVVRVGYSYKKGQYLIREIEIFKNSTDTGWCLLAQGLQKGRMVFSSISVLEVS